MGRALGHVRYYYHKSSVPFLCGLFIVSVQGPADVEVKGDPVPQSELVVSARHKDGSAALVEKAELLKQVAAAHTSSLAAGF